MEIGEKTSIKSHRCPYNCGAVIYAASHIGPDDVVPTEGDFTMCGKCGGPLIYNADQTTRLPTTEETDEMQKYPEFEFLYSEEARKRSRQ